MRNILAHPLRAEEVILVLEKAQEEYNKKQSFGGIDSVVYRQLINFMKNPDNAKLVLDFKSND